MNRRGFLTGVAGLLAAPAIVRVSSLMPVRPIPAIGMQGLFVGTPGAVLVAFDPGAGEEMAVIWRVVDTYTPDKPVLFWGPIPEAAYAS